MDMRWPVGLAVAALLLVACGTGDPTGETPADSPDGAWVLVEGTGPDGPIPMIEAYPITLTIDRDNWGGTAACNHYGGTVAVDGNQLTVHDVVVTEMACPDPGVMESERAYLHAFLGVTTHEVTPDRLTLSGETVRLLYEPAPPVEDADLAVTLWEIVSLIEDGGPDGSVSQATHYATLLLGEDGRFTAFTGCREATGRWAYDGADLVFSDVVQDDRACAPDETFQDEHVLHVLTGRVDYELVARRLVLVAPDGRGLDYRAP